MKQERATTFEDFQVLAKNLKRHTPEVIDFPEGLRKGFEEAILLDLDSKLPKLNITGSRILDIGSGCGELALKFIQQSFQRNQELHVVDGREVLANLPDSDNLVKHYGKIQDLIDLRNKYHGYFDVIVCYSVFQYIVNEVPNHDFLTHTLALLNEGGMLLIGDIPNTSMRFRMLKSNYGREFHKTYTNSESEPDVSSLEIQGTDIDDSIIYSMLMRARTMGVQSYILPQNPNLAFSNRREDLLFVKY